ncbi:MAG: hypothetical protein ACOYMA_00655 [Bacteroidia bacterium]
MTSYPTEKDATSYFSVIDGSTSVNAALFGKFSSAILAIENELGIKPSNQYSDVRQRLDRMELGLGTLNNYSGSHSITVATHYLLNWISPEITLPDSSIEVLLKIIGQVPMNLRNEAGFPDGYGALYFVNRFYVDNDIDNFKISLWEVTHAPIELNSYTFTTPGEHTYSVLLGLSLVNSDRIYEIRASQTSSAIIPTEINSVFWHSRLLFLASGIFDGGLPATELKYITTTFAFTDVYNLYKNIGTIETQSMVQSVAIIIDTPFNGPTEITIGDATNNDILMNATENIPSATDTYRNNSDYEYTVSTPINIYFPVGTPTVGSGTVIVYYH